MKDNHHKKQLNKIGMLLHIKEIQKKILLLNILKNKNFL